MAKIHTKEYQYFLGKFKKARWDAGMSQYLVAERLNVKQQYISKCELGERRMDIVDLSRFADLYKKSLDYFRPSLRKRGRRRR